MPAKKKLFGIKKINKRKKGLPAVQHNAVKRFVRRYNTTLRHAALVGLTVLAMLFVYHFQKWGGYLFKASVLETPPPFTGTVFPVDKVPDWTHWTGDNKTTAYTKVPDSMLVSLPTYNVSQMQVPDSSLKWGNTADDVTRNMKITYPVVYLGDYEFDHKEYAGSHPAVDIRMPVGTPVKAIANGIVMTVSMQSDGFGHHVVIEHKNFPDPDDQNKKTTLYSCYDHMDQISVKEGDEVSKGQLIGTSGNTGTSTTPHLHLQLDRDTAPWHPYWPFTWQESQNAGLDFFSAVNAGLGEAKGKQYTANPMTYITKYLNYSGYAGSSNPVSTGSSASSSATATTANTAVSSTTTNSTAADDTIPPVETVAPGNEDSKVDTTLFAFRISGDTTSMVENGVTLTATDTGDQISKMNDTDEVRVTVKGGRVSKSSFRKVDFSNGNIQFIVNSDQAGTTTVEIGKSAYQVNFVNQVQPIAGLEIDSDGHFQKGQVEVIKVVALDANNNPTPAVNFTGTIQITAKQGTATFTPDTLNVNDFKNGVAEVRMISTASDPVIVRAQDGALVGESEKIIVEDSQLFSDVSKVNPHYTAIKYLADAGIISGYSDGTFKPDSTVNRAEALKMLMKAFNMTEGPATKLPFSDTDGSAWYASAVSTALEKSIVKGYSDNTFRPGDTVNKAEYLKILFLTAGITPAENLSANPYSDVPKDAWYAGYAYLTNKKNLLEVVNNRLDAGNGMTRGDVAETIYRLTYIEDHNLVTYSG